MENTDMPKYRQLHTQILDSFDFNEMPDDFTRLVWTLLPLILDSEGRGIDNMDWVKSKMFPLRSDVTTQQLSKVFDWLDDRGMIVRYSANNRLYFCIPTFKKYQKGTEKEAESLLPSPPELVKSSSGVDQAQVGAAESASESESAFESEEELVRVLEKVTGLLAAPAFTQAITELLEMHAAPVDIKAGYDWLKAQGKVVKYYGSLVGPTRTAMSKRLNPKGNGAPTIVPIQPGYSKVGEDG